MARVQYGIWIILFGWQIAMESRGGNEISAAVFLSFVLLSVMF